MSEFLAMGGYGFYIWGAYGVAALAIVVELLALRARRLAAAEAQAEAGAR
jgi:heme exporter protein D